MVPSLCSPAEASALGTAYANAGWAGRTQITLNGLDAELTRYDARLVNTANQMARIGQVREDYPCILYDFLVFPRKSGYTMPDPPSLSAKQEEVEKKYSDSPKFRIGGWQIRPNCNQVSNDIDELSMERFSIGRTADRNSRKKRAKKNTRLQATKGLFFSCTPDLSSLIICIRHVNGRTKLSSSWHVPSSHTWLSSY